MSTRILCSTPLFILAFMGQPTAYAQPTFDETLVQMREVMLFEDERAETARSHIKIDEALQAFLDTDFMKKYKEIRLESESLVSTFKAHTAEFSPEDIAEVKKAYIRTADQFNALMLEIKKDLLDKQKIKYIKKYPDLYSASMELRLRDLQDEYTQTFERSVAEVTGSDAYSAIPIAAIISLVKLGIDLTNYLVRSGFESKKIKEEHLNIFLIEPYKFKDWESIE